MNKNIRYLTRLTLLLLIISFLAASLVSCSEKKSKITVSELEKELSDGKWSFFEQKTDEGSSFSFKSDSASYSCKADEDGYVFTLEIEYTDVKVECFIQTDTLFRLFQTDVDQMRLYELEAVINVLEVNSLLELFGVEPDDWTTTSSAAAGLCAFFNGQKISGKGWTFSASVDDTTVRVYAVKE